MSCAAVAASPALACHSPSMLLPDDPGLLNDLRSSLPGTGLDMSPPPPLLCGTPKLSPLLPSSKSLSSLSPVSLPSSRVLCSPKTPPSIWASPLGTPTARSLCLCGPFSICSTCSSALATNEARWRSYSDKRSYNDAKLEAKRIGGNFSTLESPSPRQGSTNSYSSASSVTSHTAILVAPPSVILSNIVGPARYVPRTKSCVDTPATSLGFSGHSLFSPRPVSRQSCASAKVHPLLVDEAGTHREQFSADRSTTSLRSFDSSAVVPKAKKFNIAEAPSGNADAVISEISGPTGRPCTPPLKRKRPPKLEIPHGVNCVVPNSMPHPIDLGEEALNEMSVEGPYFGVSCKRGRRDVLEDTHRAMPDLHGDPGQAFFGVFDGHGGRKAADFAAQNLVHNIASAMHSLGEGEGYMEAAVRAGYLTTDAEFLEKRISSGTSCVTALIKDGYLVVANAGDCRAVMSRAGSAEALTCDHRAGREDERHRIETLGGFVDNLTGIWRVQGVLAVSRGIGDLHLKEWISAEPEVHKLPITEDCEFLVLASDGLWDVVSNQEAVDVARFFLQFETASTAKPDLTATGCMETNYRNSSRSSPLECPGTVAESQTQASNSKPDDDTLDICVGTLDTEVVSIGFPFSPIPETGPVAACKKLVEMSVQRGCHDDISVMIVKLQNFCRNPASTRSSL